MNVICEDGPVIAVNKQAGVISQGAPAGLTSLADQVKDYLKKKYNKPGAVYLGIPHRLDRRTSGVMVFARNSKSAARLSDQFAKRKIKKTYQAILEKPLDSEEGILEDWIYRIPDHSRVEIHQSDKRGAKIARLRYRTLAVQQSKTIIEVELETGRMHQIRIQFASRGYPIIGDDKYGAKSSLQDRNAIGLHAWQLELIHPIRKEPLIITAPTPKEWKALGFKVN